MNNFSPHTFASGTYFGCVILRKSSLICLRCTCMCISQLFNGNCGIFHVRRCNIRHMGRSYRIFNMVRRSLTVYLCDSNEVYKFITVITSTVSRCRRDTARADIPMIGLDRRWKASTLVIFLPTSQKSKKEYQPIYRNLDDEAVDFP